MDEPDNDEALENPSSDLDSHLNSLIKNIYDDECDSIICSHVTKNEEPTIVYTFSPENKHFIPLDHLTEDKDIHHLHSYSDDSEDGKKIYDRPVVETLNSRRINSYSQNAIIECATQTVGINGDPLVLQITDNTMKIIDTQGLGNKRKRSYPGFAHDKGYPTSSWPSDSSKLRNPKRLSCSKQAKINKACVLKSKLLKHEEYRTQSKEIFTEEIESLPELSCYNREQMAGVVSESLGSKMGCNIIKNDTQNAYCAALSQESLFDDTEAVMHVPDEQESLSEDAEAVRYVSDEQVSLFDDAEAVTYVPNEQVPLKNYTQSVALSTTSAPSFDFSCATSSQAFVLSMCSKYQTAPMVEALDSVNLHMPLVTEQAVAPVSTLLSPDLPGPTSATFSLSPLIPQIPAQMSYEACFQIEEARHAQLPSVETIIQPELRIIEATQADLPLIEEVRPSETALIEEARQPELPLIEEARQPELPMIEEARQPDLPLIDEARQPELPLIEEARQLELPLIEEARQPELPLIEEARQPELPLIEEARQPELPLIEEARQPELPLIEEARQPELPLIEEARQPGIPLIEEARQPDLPLIEKARQPELPLIEEARQPELSLIEEARQPELPLIEEAKQPELPLIEEARQPELPLIEEARQPGLPLIEEARQPDLHLIEKARQPELPLIEEARQPELSLIEEARQPELPLIEEARQPELPLIEEARQPELPLIEEAKQPELPLIEEARQPELPLIEEARQPELPLIEEAKQPELPLIEEARQPELPLIEEAKQPELPLIEEARQPELPLIAKVTQTELVETKQMKQPHIKETRQSEKPLLHEANQTELPLIQEGKESESVKDEIKESGPLIRQSRESELALMQGAEQTELLITEDTRQTELTLIAERRHSELGQIEEARHTQLLLSFTTEGLHSLCNTQSESQDKVPCVSENGQFLFCLPRELSNEQQHKLIVTQTKEENSHSNFLEASCRDIQSKANKTVPDSLHAVESLQSIVPQNSEVYLRKDETFLDATKVIKYYEGSSENACESRSTLKQISATDDSPEYVISACDRSAPKICQYQYKHLVSDIRKFDCEHQEMPRSPPILINMDGISYSLPSTDHIVPHCEHTLLEEMVPGSGVDNTPAVTDDDGTCKDSEQTVLPSIEVHSYVSITKPLDNNEAVSNQKIISSCTSNHQGSSTRFCVKTSPDLHESKEHASGSSANNDSLQLYILENQAHAHPSNEASFIYLEDTLSREEQKVPEAEPCQDLSLNEMSMYSNLPEVEHGDLKCKKQIKQVFQWNSVYATAMNKSLIEQSSDSVLDGLSAIVPIVQSHRPLRVGLSRKQKVKHLHNKS